MNGRLHQTNVSPTLTPLATISRLAFFDFTSFERNVEINEDEVNAQSTLVTPTSCHVADKTIIQADASESRDATSAEEYRTPQKPKKKSLALDCKTLESNEDMDSARPVLVTPTSCNGVDDVIPEAPEASRDTTSADANKWTSQTSKYEKNPVIPVQCTLFESNEREVVEVSAHSPIVSPPPSNVADEIIPEVPDTSYDATLKADTHEWKSPSRKPQNDKKQLESDWTVFKCHEDEVEWVCAPPPLVTPTSYDQIIPEASLEAMAGEGDRWASRMLITVLKQQPPLHVVQFILSVDPKAAGIPRNGPTPLQVAVQNNASVEVVQQLLEVCPFSLCVRGGTQDPLTYSKQYRREDKALIEILQRPLHHWIHNHNSEERDPGPTQMPTLSPVFVIEEGNDRNGPPLQTQERPVQVDKQEIDNIKILCAQVVKGFRKLANQVSDFQERLDAAHLEKTQQIIAKLQEEQKKQFHRQLIALDMRERSIKNKLKKMEHRCIKRCGEKVEGWKEGMDQWKTGSEDRFSEWHSRMENEIQVSANFRSDLTRWIEEQSSESKKDSFLFATSLGETNETAPLFPKNASSEHVKKRSSWFSRFSKKKGSGRFPFRRSGRIKLEDTNE